jgi:hypothetical protein
MAKGSRGTKKREDVSRSMEWTVLEQAFAVIIVILIVTTAVAFYWKKETVRVEYIDERIGAIDLRLGDAENSTFYFERGLKGDYQIAASYKLVGSGPLVHFKVYNDTMGVVLISETTASTFYKRVTVASADSGEYRFEWWVTGTTGTSRVEYDVLIEPTEKLVT